MHTPFSTGSSGFGQKPVFGAFGSNPAQTSPFGSTTQASQPAFGSSIFGSSTPFGGSSQPAFGATTTPAYGATSTPAFGATSSPAFGATITPAFGASSTPAFGAFHQLLPLANQVLHLVAANLPLHLILEHRVLRLELNQQHLGTLVPLGSQLLGASNAEAVEW
ncbi:hypothetical protein EV2_039569 [Malus domestica]